MAKSKKSVKSKSVQVKKEKRGFKESATGWLRSVNERRKAFLKRRPHRSFQRTRRRDYMRSLKLPGYIAMTKQIFDVLGKNKRIFIGLAVLYGVLAILMSSMMSQETYSQLREVVDEVAEEGDMSGLVANFAILWGVFASQLTGTSADGVGSSQQIFVVLFGLYLWLAVIWILRSVMAGKRPRVRDGLYSSGSPVLALLVLVFVLIIQIIPAAIAIIAYGAADASGLLDQTAILMLFGGGAFLLVALSLYWATSTFFAMVVVALPGMYPLKALRIAGDLVVGRRVRILLRLLWSIILLLAIWVAVLLPTILIDGALKSALPDLNWLPLVPFVALMLMSFSLVFEACYVYILYRKIVDDGAAPAQN